MKVILDIPNYEFNNDIADKFQDYFNRVKQDIADGTMCGNYELETTEMFLASFKRLQVLPDNATNGDMVKAMFPNMETEFIDQRLIYPNGLYKSELREKPYNAGEDNLVFVLRSLADWWNAPYKGVN